MSIEKRFINNIVKFPGSENKELDNQQKEILKHTASLASKMSDPSWHHYPITTIELKVLANHGETIEFAPITAARLNSVLAQLLLTKSILEEIL